MLTREVPEGTHVLVGGLEKLMEVWNKISSISGVFDDYTRGKAEAFVELYLRRDTWWLERDDGLGILYMTMIHPGLSAFAHIIYWDKKLRGKEAFTMDCLLFTTNLFDLKKVNVTLPEYAHAARGFAERIGFKAEGLLRNWSYCNGKLYSVYWYGMTKEEIINGAGLLSKPDIGEQPEAVSGDGGPAEVHNGAGGTTDESAGDAIREHSSILDAGGHQPELTRNPGLPYEDPENGGD